MFDLKKEAKRMAQDSAGLMIEMSMKSDWFIFKTDTQININMENDLRKASLGHVDGQISKAIKGKSGDKLKTATKKIKAYTYYNRGADSI